MRHPLSKLLTLGLAAAWFACTYAEPQSLNHSIEQTTSVSAHNPLGFSRTAAPTFIPLTLINLVEGPANTSGFVTKANGQPVAHQLVDTNHDGESDSLLLLLDYDANEKQRITVTQLINGTLAPSFPALTQAEMAVRIGGTQNEKGVWQGGHYQPVNELHLPPHHTIGDKLIKYEGFGWESNKVGYRFYFDHRGLIDIFGKKLPAPVLHTVGLDGGDYHSMADWGMDILKVGPSLGLAGVASWENQKISAPHNLSNIKVTLNSGALQSEAVVTQFGWPIAGASGKITPTDLTRRFTINAHSHLTRVQASANQPISVLATGIVKHNVETIQSNTESSEWQYIATFGQQSLAKDELGMVIFYKHVDLHRVTEDELNELVLLNMGAELEFYFGARWAGEANPVKTKAEFIQYLETTRNELNNPIQVSN